MKTTGLTGGNAFVREDRDGDQRVGRMTLQQLRHDIRNHLNAIKLSCALLHRRHGADEFTEESVREVDRSADAINELVTRFMGDADAPSLLSPSHRDKHE